MILGEDTIGSDNFKSHNRDVLAELMHKHLLYFINQSVLVAPTQLWVYVDHHGVAGVISCNQINGEAYNKRKIGLPSAEKWQNEPTLLSRIHIKCELSSLRI